MAKYRVAVLGATNKSILIDDAIGSQLTALTARVDALEGVGNSRAHRNLTGLTQGDDHPQYTMWQAAETVTGPWNFATEPRIGGELLTEFIQDVVGMELVEDTASIAWTYNDATAELEANVVEEWVEDLVGAMVLDTATVNLTYNDATGQISADVLVVPASQISYDPSASPFTATNVQDALDEVQSLGAYKGFVDCSANPNYPAAIAGDYYIVSVAGKIGGGSGVDVLRNDVIICTVDNAGGTQASVGADWDVVNNQDVDDAASFRASASTNQTLTNDTFTVINFDGTVFDRTSGFNTTTHRFVATVAGDYQFNGSVRIASAGSMSEGRVAIFKNGSVAAQGNLQSPVGAVDTTPIIAELIHLDAGDYVDLRAYKFGGSNATIIAAQSFFSGFMARRT